MMAWPRGKRHTPETRAKMSAAKKGKPGNWLGKSHTPETRAKISAAKKGKKGTPHTPETRAKISAAHLRRSVIRQSAAE